MNLKAYSAVCFDLDGTLADSFLAIAMSVNHVRAARGFPPLPVEEVKRHVGRGAEYLFQHTIPGSRYEEDIALYREHHPRVMLQGTTLLPGARDVLAALAKRRTRIALCSNKPRLFSGELLKLLGIAEYFTAVVGPEDVKNLKPAPDMLLFAMERLQADPEETLFIGDMTVDIETARAAGVAVWVAPTGSQDVETLRAAGPDRVLNGLVELLDEI